MDSYAVSPGWRVLATDLGVDLGSVLRAASLPPDLMSRPGARITAGSYFALWEAVAASRPEDDVAVLASRAVTAEAFDPALFAGLCSPNLGIAARRVATYKRLLYPVTLDVVEDEELAIAVRPRIPTGWPTTSAGHPSSAASATRSGSGPSTRGARSSPPTSRCGRPSSPR